MGYEFCFLQISIKSLIPVSGLPKIEYASSGFPSSGWVSKYLKMVMAYFSPSPAKKAIRFANQ